MIWLSFFRASGAFSALSSVWCAYWLTGGSAWQPFLCISLASAGFFCAGMGLNDLVDIDKDRRLRPERPLPSGRLSSVSAWWAVICLMGFSTILSFIAGKNHGLWALALLLSLLCYNFGPRGGWFSSTSIALCRATNFLMGAQALEIPAFLYWGAVAHALHATCILEIAEGEDRSGHLSRKWCFLLAGTGFSIGSFTPGAGWLSASLWSGVQGLLALWGHEGSRHRRVCWVGYAVISYSLLDALLLCSLNFYPEALLCISVLLPAWLARRKAGPG